MCDVNEDTNQRTKETEVTLCLIYCLTHRAMYWPGLAKHLDKERPCTCTKLKLSHKLRSDFSVLKTIRVKCLLCSSLYSSYNSEIIQGKDPGV